MISVNWAKLLGEFGDLAKAYESLPAHIAKKHLLASMRRAIKASGGVQKLRANTPPTNVRRGRRKKGEKRSTGELRKSVTTKSRWIGRNKDGWAVAGLGYKYGNASRKAIWHEFGTTRMKGVAIMQRTFDSIKDQVASRLSVELKNALEAAANEKNSGKNQGYQG
jgi:HK97 gp10 family phage protein